MLNGKDIVRDPTLARVLDAIETLGYRPDLYASNLARRKNRLIGLIVSNLLNPFFAETAQVIEDEAGKRGYQISVAETSFDPRQLESAINRFLAMRVAGLAIMTSEISEKVIKNIQIESIPAIFLDVARPGRFISNIHVDSGGGMDVAVRHLIELGHRNLLLVKNSSRSPGGHSLLSHKYRNQGFSAAIRKYGNKKVKASIVDVEGPSADAGLKAMEQSYGKINFTAVLCVTDMVALGVYRGLQDKGVNIPGEISVVGFDNTYICEFLDPRLTTIDIPRRELGVAVVDTLLSTIEREQSGKEVEISTHLVVRQSTARRQIV